jgi:hypothetical protein
MTFEPPISLGIPSRFSLRLGVTMTLMTHLEASNESLRIADLPELSSTKRARVLPFVTHYSIYGNNRELVSWRRKHSLLAGSTACQSADLESHALRTARTLLRVLTAARRTALVLLRLSSRPAGFGSHQNNLPQRTQKILSALPKMHRLPWEAGPSHRFAWCVPVAFRDMGPKEIPRCQPRQ